MHWLYQIETIDTEQVYTGITGQANVFQRFQEHIETLVGGRHNELFQAVWTNNPTICNLSFRPVARYESKEIAEFNEARVITDIWPQHCLNVAIPVRGGSMLYRISTLEQMGFNNGQIADKVGISPGYASKLRRKIRDSKIFV